MSAPLRPWPVVRALLVGAVIAVEWLDALPLPTLRPSHLKQPIAQAELARWTQLLNDLGVSVSEEELAERGLAVGEASIAFQKTAMAPFRPLKRLTQTGQSWGLFAYPDPFAGRLIVEAEVDGEWQPRFRAPERGASLLSRQMRYRRVRGVYDDLGDRHKPRGAYNRLVDWIAGGIFEAEPAVSRVQVRLDLVTVKLPGEGDEPPEKRRHARVRSRAKWAARP